MSIIVEGVDGTGKTTFINNFIRFYSMTNYIYIHNWTKPKNDIDIDSEAMKEILLLTYTENIIFDRSFIFSEYVYSQVLNRHSTIKISHLIELVNLINYNHHTVKLFYFKDIDYLHIANQEDNNLPLKELNDFYVDLFKNKLKIEYMIFECIDNRRSI